MIMISSLMFSGISNWSWPSGVPRALFKHCSKYFWYRHLSCSTSKHQHSQFRIQSIFQTGSRFAQDNKSPNSFDPIAHSWWWKSTRKCSSRCQSKLSHYFFFQKKPPKILKCIYFQEKYFYAIYDMTVRGSCSCYGHADVCLPDQPEDADIPGMIHGKCDCKHNTRGANCELCLEDHNDVPWMPATGNKKNECKSKTQKLTWFRNYYSDFT